MGLLGLFSRREVEEADPGFDESYLDDEPDMPEAPVVPSMCHLSRIRRIHEGMIEDLYGRRFAVWRLRGHDPRDPSVLNGWQHMLNSIEWPIQAIIRQHKPDFSDISRKMIEARPDGMKVGRINNVANSLLDHLLELEGDGGAVARHWYLAVSERYLVEMTSVIHASSLDAEMMDQRGLEDLYVTCLSGMGLGHRQEFFQAKEGPGELEFNIRFASVYELHKWPRRISPLFLENFLNLGEEVDVSIHISPVGQKESHNRLQMQLTRHQGARLAAEQKGRMVPPEVELTINDISRISDGVERGTNRLFRRSMTVAVYAADREKLRRAHETVTGYFRSSMSGLRLLRYRQGQGFAGVMPVVRPGLGGLELTDGGTMRCMFPFGPVDMDRREGVLLGMDLRSRTPVFVDAFSPGAMNGHMVVMARSGAGKSYAVKLRVFREATRDVPVYLVDPEGEYSVITRELGGQVYVPGAKGFGLNPFLIGYTDENDLYKRIASLGALIVMMLGDNVGKEMRATIDRCLVGFYNRELESARSGEGSMLGSGGMTDFHAYLQTKEAVDVGGAELYHLLSVFATGSARFLLQGGGNDLMLDEAPVTSFNLKNLPNSLKPVATAVCSEVVWGLAVTRPRPRLLVVDECWTVLSTASGAESLLTVVKRARKYQLGLVAITQDVQDFLAENPAAGIAGHAGRSLLQNSALKLAFSQDAAALPMVVDALALNQDSAAYLAQSIRGQGILVGPHGDSYPLSVHATREEDALITDMAWLSYGESPDEEIPDVDLDEVYAGAGASRAGGGLQNLSLGRLEAERES